MGDNLYRFKPDYVIHPGEYVVEMLDTYGMRQKELAIRLGMTAKHLNHIIKGKASITPETAQALEHVFPNPASYWLNIQMEYDIGVERQNREAYYEQHREECEAWLDLFDFANLVKQGYVKPIENSLAEKVDALLNFFGCADISSWNTMYCSELPASCRITGAENAKLGNTSAWLRYGQILALERVSALPAYNREAFRDALNSIRKLTSGYDDFSTRMKELCAAAGVCLLFVKEIPKAGISGAAFWIKENTVPCIQMNLRYKKNDHFWFTFFHEAVHILKEHKKIVYVDCEKKTENEIEKETDILAGNLLIPKEKYKQFLSKKTFYRDDIIKFADEIGIHPGIVAGRLQHDGVIDWQWHNDLKQTIDWQE